MATVEDNDVADALGVGIFCGDYSSADIEGIRVSGYEPDTAPATAREWASAILAHYRAIAEVEDNEITSPGGTAACSTGAFSAKPGITSVRRVGFPLPGIR